MSVNKVIIVGNLGKDPEIKSFQNGGKIANFSVATSESWKDRNTGEKKEKTEWHNVSIKSEGLAGVAERFLHKGSKVYLEGKIETRKWQDNNGNDRYMTEIILSGPRAVLVMLGGNNQNSSSNGQASDNNNSEQNNQSDGWENSNDSSGGFDDDLDDDLPF